MINGLWLPDGDSNWKYTAWCMKNLFVPGNPKSWSIYKTMDGGVRIVFLNLEDLLAFKMVFGL